MTQESTLSYYQANTEDYIEQTKSINMTPFYDWFIESLPFHLGPQRILDVGCGSGRDSFYFASKLAMKVTAIDANPLFIEHAKHHYGADIVDWMTLSFEDIDNQPWQQQFTAIWASASLLHVPFAQLPKLLDSLLSTLKSDGILYASFKHGDSERIDEHGRFFCDINEERLAQLISSLTHMPEEYEIWNTKDLRQQQQQPWLNVILRT
ncbi:class I SAM-dependent methyltransferase [Psychrobacter sp. FDAARGOS_221]|uniref:class I SAM-dependent methyltransferase n=1 Tax=Psychrobacter sp. FDAARGOS_221 TaxID=1975705 RepID=UPI000BB59B5E|nr:class I SAM-dependent methyltransferase [Psychrobacter sp. FDAARGOS_221]PNK59821.1 class I SAM-dependent methyltransferase [Psychrobacter sp. FDAARGOS_221]